MTLDGHPFDPSHRVSDADRDRVASQLREAFAEGRLTADEFNERAGSALAARTGADLMALTVDLPTPNLPRPALPTAGPPGLPASAPSPLTQLRTAELRRIWTAWASMAILLTAVWVLTAVTSSSVPVFWPAWPLGITGALGLARTVNIRSTSRGPRPYGASRSDASPYGAAGVRPRNVRRAERAERWGRRR